MAETARLVGYRTVVATSRVHIVSVVHAGGSHLYLERAICGGLQGWVIPRVEIEAKSADALDFGPTMGREPCPRCTTRARRAKVAS